MALPLLGLLGVGAGILGGGQFLLKKMDDRRSESLLGDLQSAVANSGQFGQLYGDRFLHQAQALADSGNLLNRTSGGVQSLLQNFQSGAMQYAMQQQQRELEMANAYSKTNEGRFRDLQTRYNSELSDFAEVQTQFKAAFNALDNPSNLNGITALYNLFSILEPGGRVTQNEDGTFTGLGDAGNRFANWMNEWMGEGLSEATRQEIMDSLYAQYNPRWLRANNVKRWYDNEIKNMSQSGYNVRSPVGSLGIDWQLNQVPDPRLSGVSAGGPQGVIDPSLVEQGWRLESQ